MGSRAIKGATRLCAVTEIALRFLDILRVNGQQWFYRPVSAFLTGHLPGGVTKKAAAPKAAPKAAVVAPKATVVAPKATAAATAAPKAKSATLVRKKKIGPLAALND